MPHSSWVCCAVWIELRHDIKEKGLCKAIFGASNTELRRFWYTIIYVLFTLYGIGMFNVIAQNRAILQDVEGPISDIGFDLFYSFTDKLYASNPWIGDQLVVIMVIMCAMWILLFMGRINEGYERRIVIYKRWMLLFCILFNIRCITIISTVLPRPWRDDEEWRFCKGENTEYTMFSWNIIKETALIIIGEKAVCYDFFFSGHTTNVVLISLLVTKYSKCTYLKILIWSMAIFTMIAVIAARAHYTIDIWGALIITVLLFKVFDLEVESKKGIFYKLEHKDPECVEEGSNDNNNNNDIETANGDEVDEDRHNNHHHNQDIDRSDAYIHLN